MQKCNLWPHTDKTGGFQRGAMPPLWHTTLLARCSVLYLLARLTGETGCNTVSTPLTLAGKRAGFCDREGTKTVRFQRAAAGIQSPHMQAETTILSIYYLSNIFDRNRYCSVRIIYKFYVFRIIKKIRGYCYFNSCISFNFMLFAFPNGIGSFDGNRYRDTLLMDLLYKFFGKSIRFRKNHMAQFNCI